jgi:hypothetical protein
VKFFFTQSIQNLKTFRAFIRFSLIFGAALIFCLLAAACHPDPLCTDPDGCWFISANEDIEIAIDTSTSTNAEISRGIQLFQALSPTFAGHSFKVLEQIIQCYTGKVEAGFSQLITSTNVVAFIGPACNLDVDRSLRLLSDSGVPILSPISLAIDGDFPYWLPISSSVNQAALDVANLLAEHYAAPNFGLIIENSPARRDFADAICKNLADLQRICNRPILVDSGVLDLSAYLPPAQLGGAQVWIFIYSTTSFSKLTDLITLQPPRTFVLVDPDESRPIFSSSPLETYDFIGQSAPEINQEFTLAYENRYNGQNTLVAYKAYQAAGMIRQAIENTAITLKDKSILLPRTAFKNELLALQSAPAGYCLTPIQSSQFMTQDQECP